MTSNPPDIRVQMVSDPTYLSGARDLVSAVARRLGFSEEGCGQIALAVDEALCNVIRHGYDRRSDGRIWVYIWPLEESESHGSPGGIRVVIEDEAKQVDPSKIKSRDLDEIRPGVLRAFSMQQVMDHVVFQPREHRSTGMRLILVKAVPPADAPAATGAVDHGHQR